MANAVEKVNGIAIASIEAINGKTDDNIQALNGLEFTGSTTVSEDMPLSNVLQYTVMTNHWSGGWVYRDGVTDKVLAVYNNQTGGGIIEVIDVPATASATLTVDSTATLAGVDSGREIAVDTDPSTENEGVAAYPLSSDSGHGRVVRVTVSEADESVSTGTAVEFSTEYAYEVCVAHDKKRAGDFVAMWRNTSPYEMFLIAGTTSGTTISLGSATRINNGAGTPSDVSGYYPSIAADPHTAGRYVLQYNDTSNITVQVITVSGTTITFGASVSPGSDAGYTPTRTGVTWDNQTADKIHTIYSDAESSNYYPTVAAATVSTRTLSFGTPEVVESVYREGTSISSDYFIANAGFVTTEMGPSGNATVKVFAWTVSGTDYTIGNSNVATTDPATVRGSQIASPYTGGLHLIMYKDNTSSTPNYEGRLATYQLGGTY